MTGLADAVAGVGFDVHVHRRVARRRFGDPRAEFTRVHRIDATVRFRRRDEHRGIALAVAHVVVRRIRAQKYGIARVVGVTVLGDPQTRDQELVKAQHIGERHQTHDGPREFGPLRRDRGDE